jgi:multicomponent Na+:H+ antiporter subunit C
MAFFPYVVAAWLFVAGLFGIATSRNFMHLVSCLAVVQSSTYILLLNYRLSRWRDCADLLRYIVEHTGRRSRGAGDDPY